MQSDEETGSAEEQPASNNQINCTDIVVALHQDIEAVRTEQPPGSEWFREVMK